MNEYKWFGVFILKKHCCSGLIGASVIFNHANENWWWQMLKEQEYIFADFNV